MGTRRPISACGAGLAVMALALATVPAPAGAQAAPRGRSSPPAEDRKAAEDRVETVAVPIGDTGLSRGRSTVTVRAPLARVRAAVLGFSKYPEFMPHYEQCRVLGRTRSGGRDVYMEVSALHGAVKMWARLEITRSASGDGAETYASRFLDGNVKDLQATWRLQKIDAERTRLSLEVFLHPRLPLPRGLLNAENLDGSARGVSAMRARAEALARR